MDCCHSLLRYFCSQLCCHWKCFWQSTAASFVSFTKTRKWLVMPFPCSFLQRQLEQLLKWRVQKPVNSSKLCCHPRGHSRATIMPTSWAGADELTHGRALLLLSPGLCHCGHASGHDVVLSSIKCLKSLFWPLSKGSVNCLLISSPFPNWKPTSETAQDGLKFLKILVPSSYFLESIPLIKTTTTTRILIYWEYNSVI